MVGEVARIGDGISTDSLGRPLKEGDRVVYPYFYACHRCWACASGRYHLCSRRTTHYQEPLGSFPSLNGGFSEFYYLRPGHFVFKVPDELPDELVSPANCALSQVIYSLRQADFKLGDTSCAGRRWLGLNAIAVARDMGAESIIAVDGNTHRLELARQFGADELVSIDEYSTPEARVQRVRELTGGRGASAVLEVVGLPHVIQEGLQMVQPGGTYLEVGLVSAASASSSFLQAYAQQHPATWLSASTSQLYLVRPWNSCAGTARVFLSRRSCLTASR